MALLVAAVFQIHINRLGTMRYITRQKNELNQMISDKAVLDDDATIRRKYRFFDIRHNSSDRIITSFLYVSMIIFSSSLDILDAMRPIRCIEHTNKAKFITPYVGKQVDICQAFGFDIPDGCNPTYVSKQKFSHKRGRPAKPKAETNL